MFFPPLVKETKEWRRVNFDKNVQAYAVVIIHNLALKKIFYSHLTAMLDDRRANFSIHDKECEFFPRKKKWLQYR